MHDKRFIEESFPVKEVSYYSAKEKNIRHGHISTLHIWWARRPLAASRSTAFAALVPATDYEDGNKFYDKYRKKLISVLRKDGWVQITEKSSNYELVKHFIITLCKWENSIDKNIIDLARAMILDYNKGVPPKTLDPFGGGGSIPLECLRLGCETYSNDLNPVAVLIQKCTLEYPQKYGKPGYVERDVEEIEKGEYVKKKKQIYVENVLLEDVKYWGNWVLEEAKKELAQFYPPDPDGSTPVGYIWARTIPCQNPACKTDIPLLSHFWLSIKNRRKIALKPKVVNKEVHFEIVGDKYSKFPISFDPENGTIKRSVATCLICGSTVEATKTRELFINKKNKERLIAVVLKDSKNNLKKYRLVNQTDIEIFDRLKALLKKKTKDLETNWGFYPIPDEELPLMSGVFNVPLYGFNKWGDLFNDRQLLSIITLSQIIRSISFSGKKEEWVKILRTYLVLALGRLLTRSSNMCVWHTGSEQTEKIFGMQALPMKWSYPENNPLNLDNVTGYWGNIESILSVLENNHASFFNTYANIIQENASKLKFESNLFDAIFTDPPYYNSVPYADLSDFFYVWQKRILINEYPQLFVGNSTPKKDEITEMSGWDPVRYSYKDLNFFELKLNESFKEVNRMLAHGALAIIVYAHKTTSGWETLINSILDSNLVISAAWPINTELESRIRAKDAASLSSSIYLVCRKIDRQPTAFYNDVKEETKNYLTKKLDRLWNEGISGPDFFIAAIGSSIEVFGKYLKVIDYEGNVIRANKLLEDVRIIVTDYAVKKILHNGFATGISDLTRFYVLCRWEFKAAKIPFDEANKLAHSCHIELSDYWQTKSFIKKEKEFVLVAGPQDRDIDDVEDSGELIDVLHYAIKLWEKGRKADMQKVLNESGYAKSDSFFRVAQAIAETLPNESKEKKLLEGFLNLREKISEGAKVRQTDSQKDLFD